jgi:DNA-binding NtrC family response regulator
VVRVLLAIPEQPVCRRVRLLLRRQGLDPAVLPARHALWSRLTHEDYDLVVLGAGLLPPDAEGLVTAIRRLPERPEVVVLRPREDAEERARLLAAGCLAILWQGLPDAMLGDAFHALIERRQADTLQRLRAERPEQRHSLRDFVSASPAMQEFVRMARHVVGNSSTLLILGETGVGKELLARAIHADGPRAGGPFIAVNCGALPEALLESELFGHEEGAFTGATRSRKGYFELAHQGTIFLDEVGEMPLHLQVKLLHALERGRVQRVGGERPVRIDVRIMAATNRLLEAEIKAGRFRLDLYYRLAVVTLTVPALRDRREDVPALVESYRRHFAQMFRKPVTAIAPEAMAALTSYEWPGNVRELINVVERAVLLCQGDALGLVDLPSTVIDRTAFAAEVEADPRSGTPATIDRPFLAARGEVLARFERAYLTALLRDTRGRVGEAARRAGISERSLYVLMRKHGLQKEVFKGPT